MAAIRRLLVHVRIEVADRRRKCRRNKGHAIAKGTAHVAVYEAPRGNRRNYCFECALPIFDRAEEDLTALRAGLSSGTPYPDDGTPADSGDDD